MRFRRLQRLIETGQWEDHGYAYKRDDGRALLRYNNLVWGQIGARYNMQLRSLHITNYFYKSYVFIQNFAAVAS